MNSWFSMCIYKEVQMYILKYRSAFTSVNTENRKCVHTQTTDMFPDFLQRRPGNADTLIAMRTPATEFLLSQRSREGSR